MKFIVIYSYLKKEHISSNAVLFDSFREALNYARQYVRSLRYLASTYVEKIGDNKLHATIELRGKDLNVSIRISDMDYGTGPTLESHLSTYCSWDYIGDVAI